MGLPLGFYMGKRTMIALEFIFITRLERMKLSSCMPQDKKAMQGPSMDYTHFYSVLNRLFRKTICLRDGDPTNISHYAKNLLSNLKDGAPPFSMIDYIWEEIKGISLNPQKNCGFTPYLMFLIEDVTGRSFPKEGIHMAFRSNPTKKPLIPPVQASSPPRADPTPQQQHEAAEPIRPAGYTGQTGLGDQGQSSAQQREKSTFSIKKLFELLFGMCRSHHVIETRLHEERKAHKKLQKDMN
jgi:hypothetical protein